MSPIIKLNELYPGHCARIISLDNNMDSKRLSELGFYQGACVKPLFYGVFGDPCAFLVQNTVIALRRRESENILVNEQY